VGDQDVFALARGAGEQAVARLDALDHAFLAGGEEPDAVAGGDDVALLGGQRPQQAAHGAAGLPPLLPPDHADQALDPQHAPAPGPRRAAVPGGHRGGLLPAGGAALLLDDRPAARQVALGADALVAGRRLLGEAVFVKAARPLPLPRRLGAVLAQIDPNFLL